MKHFAKFIPLRLALVVAGGLAATIISSHAQSAVATISAVQAGGSEWDYTISLENTGTTSLEGFWYAWTDAGNNLSLTPTSPTNSLGWSSSLFSGTSIQYQGNAGNVLGAGDSATFTFDSTETPAQITTSPQGESVVYTGTIGFNEGIAGTSSPVFSPTLVATPEPSAMALLAIGGLGLAFVGSQKLRKSAMVVNK